MAAQSKSPILRALASLKLAVVVIIAMALLIAWGTIVESRYQDAWRAKKEVYQSIWMYLVFVVFTVNLAAVLVDRWPWKRRHLSFVLAHFGIIILIFGALVTSQFGLDGTLRLAVLGSSRYVYLPESRFTIWRSVDGQKFEALVDQEVDFYRSAPSPEDPIRLPLGGSETLELLEWQPYGLLDRKIVRSQSSWARPAIQFSLKNNFVQVSDWLIQTTTNRMATYDLGPLRVHFGDEFIPTYFDKNEIYLQAQEEGIKYVLYRSKDNKTLEGHLRVGEAVQTGWMGLELRILQYFPKAEEIHNYTFLNYKTDLTQSVVKVRFRGKDYWVGQHDVTKLYTDQEVYFISYGQKRFDLGFELFLKEFRMDRYPGTQRAASYQSIVELPEKVDHVISMNEPLKYRGFTFYQASFQQGPDGTPVASILSVNYDPGRWLKYLGSLLVSLGVIILFIDRRKQSRAQLGPKNQP
ncbi:MAG: cytochrome c biogenesis protein ResB [Bdellovibrionaceae bacterium]|nr:cytochrome c biogenesis protein ResB [Pseudobdellovibrionaceae bacterium]MDW8190505.1 cytochrome c biogenesis protein ResB [Pseudobdellovibrionaceae bacterium]